MKKNRQSGFSLAEVLVSAFLLVIVFGAVFMLTARSKKSSNALHASGHHLHFESFASSRLRLFYSKLLQWTVHLGHKSGESGFRNVSNEFCKGSSEISYAAADSPLNTEIFQKTLGADMRMSLSTLDYPQVTSGAWRTDGLMDKYETDGFLWGAMVPFSAQASDVSKLERANPNLAAYCAAESLYRPTQGLGQEMCRWVDWCTGVGPETNPEETEAADVIKALAPVSGGRFISDLAGQKQFRMCFVFAGNLFTKKGSYYSAGSASSLGVNAIDNPATLGVAIATAQFVDARHGETITCEKSVYNMNRSLRVRLNLYTVLNADKVVSSKKQTFGKTVKHVTAEKLAVDTPNCSNENRKMRTYKNADNQMICIADPIFHYACYESGQSDADKCFDP